MIYFYFGKAFLRPTSEQSIVKQYAGLFALHVLGRGLDISASNAACFALSFKSRWAFLALCSFLVYIILSQSNISLMY